MVDRSLEAGFATAGQLSAIVLAAGESRRFGKANKLLQRVDDVPMLARVVHALRQTCQGELGIVIGHQADDVKALFAEDASVTVLENPRYKRGMGSSLAVGARWAMTTECDGVLVCLGDLPYLKSEDVQAVVARFYAEKTLDIVVPEVDGCRGHPVCFPRRCLSALAELDGDRGARDVIRADGRVSLVKDVSEGCVRDVDTKSKLSGADRSG